MSTLNTRKIKHDSSAVDNITLTSNGRVGIATNSPTQRFVAYDPTGGSDNIVMCESSAGHKIYMQADSGQQKGVLGTLSNHPLAFVSNNIERMRIDASGRVTKPYQPAFIINITNGDNGSEVDITPSNVLLNVGSHYSSANGRFTAPVAGLYYFQFSVLMKDFGGGDNLEVNIRKNGGAYLIADRKAYSSGATGTAGYLPGVVHAIIPMSVNDYVTFQYYKTGSTGSIHLSDVWSKISGFLIG